LTGSTASTSSRGCRSVTSRPKAGAGPLRAVGGWRTFRPAGGCEKSNDGSWRTEWRSCASGTRTVATSWALAVSAGFHLWRFEVGFALRTAKADGSVLDRPFGIANAVGGENLAAPGALDALVHRIIPHVELAATACRRTGAEVRHGYAPIKLPAEPVGTRQSRRVAPPQRTHRR
jgi:hypothetical protein